MLVSILWPRVRLWWGRGGSIDFVSPDNDHHSQRLHCTLQERCRGAVTIMLLLQLFYNLYSSEKWNIPYSQSSTKPPVIMSSCHHVIMSLILHFQRFHELNNWLTNNIRTFRSALRTWTISISHKINYEGRHFLKYLVILIIKSYFFCISCL